MAMLDRGKLLAKEDLKTKRVELDDGDFTFVRQMTGRERDRFDQSLMNEKKDRKGNTTYERNLNDFRAKLAVCTLCDEEGQNLLEWNDYKTLSMNMSAARLEKIVSEAQELNRITDEDKENLVKNSEEVQEEDSGFDSV
jgi:hypothetical protein